MNELRLLAQFEGLPSEETKLMVAEEIRAFLAVFAPDAELRTTSGCGSWWLAECALVQPVGEWFALQIGGWAIKRGLDRLAATAGAGAPSEKPIFDDGGGARHRKRRHGVALKTRGGVTEGIRDVRLHGDDPRVGETHRLLPVARCGGPKEARLKGGRDGDLFDLEEPRTGYRAAGRVGSGAARASQYRVSTSAR